MRIIDKIHHLIADCDVEDVSAATCIPVERLQALVNWDISPGNLTVFEAEALVDYWECGLEDSHSDKAAGCLEYALKFYLVRAPKNFTGYTESQDFVAMQRAMFALYKEAFNDKKTFTYLASIVDQYL